MERRSSKSITSLNQLPLHEVELWPLVYVTAATIRLKAQTNPHNLALKHFLTVFSWTNPFKILAKDLLLPLTPQMIAYWRASFCTWKSRRTLKYPMPAIVCVRLAPQAMQKNNDTATSRSICLLTSPPTFCTRHQVTVFNITPRNIAASAAHFDVDQITGHQLVRGRGGCLRWCTRYKRLVCSLRPGSAKLVYSVSAAHHVVPVVRGLSNFATETALIVPFSRWRLTEYWLARFRGVVPDPGIRYNLSRIVAAQPQRVPSLNQRLPVV